MQLGELFSKTLRVDRPFGVFGLGVAPILAEGANGLPGTGPAESAMAGLTLRITEVSEGGSVPFLRAENVGRKPVLIPDGEELVGGKQNRSSTPASSSSGRGDRHPGVLHGGGQVNFNRRDFQAGEAVFRARSRAVQKASVAASLDAEGSYRSDQGAVWREVSYSLRETQRRRQLRTTGKGARRSPTRSTRSSSAFSRWTGRSAPFSSARGILGLELLGEEDLFKRCLPKIIRSFAFEVLNDEDLGSVPEDVAASWWAGMQAAPCSRQPRPGRAMTSGSTRAR